MNSFGTLFRVSVFGESHGPSIGVVIDGCPPGITVRPEDFLNDLKRRQSGSRGTTA
ncbi:MAG: chorismate synthase, partial [Bacteroidales bacterium]|nr:chorismate synthase [Bacteroidales bacterium]